LGRTNLSIAEGSYVTSPSCHDGFNNRIWAFPQACVENPRQPYFSVSTSTGAITNYPNTGASGYLPGSPFKDAWAICAHDLGYIYIGSNTEGRVYCVDVTGTSSATVVASTRTEGFFFPTVTVAGGSSAGLTAHAGAVYHQPSRAIFVWHQGYGATLRKLLIPSNPRSGTYTWSTVTPVGGSNPSSGLNGDFNGPYSKFNIINDMGNGQAAFVHCGNISGPTHVFKVPLAGL
jgi:hypothetical protein